MRPKVSVCMITYGHEKFIREAIEGVLMQECNFDVELLIANDCSPDNTDETIKDILENHSRASWINYFKQENNIGMMPNFIFNLKRCKSQYIALCEGDDYWTDPFKLQKQVDYLDSNLDYVLCFHKIKVKKSGNVLVEDFITKVPENYETQQTFASLGNYIHTPSVVYRNIIEEFPNEFSMSPIGDYFLYFILSEYGKLKYLDDEMAVYRYGVGIHSTYNQIKLAEANFKLFTLILSYSNNFNINKILIDRQLNALETIEKLIRREYDESFVSNNVFFKALKSVKHPNKFWKKIKNKLMKN
ncbi:glycosyltransferase family 2 protein [Flavobacterium capsici]|uniref:Glycosyltransferase n=1 Tax=Flavobacterium capsici TaxID=3075618 RepID=A0AA96F285_9FLAO|nr:MULTISPECIES: glycosyltransferase [unclassified Flavobacterium]WNM20248.1 glycosyltransferase [Flavobacterium sp. PMR2A8]WNM21638.1 glycosyltransferase [Flavobacterium sp. PMTSA4]